jgi:endonuclease/exonuclease/phosphatase family metal-dependent hydrolase
MTTTLNALQYNTHLFLNTVVGLAPSQLYRDAERLDKIVADVRTLDPDIVGFSEVWANSSKDRFIEGLASQYPYHAWDENKNPYQLGSGLLLFSRYPIAKHTFTPFTRLVWEDAFSQKGFLLAEIAVGSRTILVAHTHIQADAGSDPSYAECIKARASNLQQVQAGIAAYPISLPVILLGDLNIVGEDASGKVTGEYRSLCGTLETVGLADAYRALDPNPVSAPGYTYDAVANKLIARFAPADTQKGLEQRIDYIFSRGLTPDEADVPTTFTFESPDGVMDLSDHYPLRGRFSFPE